MDGLIASYRYGAQSCAVVTPADNNTSKILKDELEVWQLNKGILISAHSSWLFLPFLFELVQLEENHFVSTCYLKSCLTAF